MSARDVILHTYEATCQANDVVTAGRVLLLLPPQPLVMTQLGQVRGLSTFVSVYTSSQVRQLKLQVSAPFCNFIKFCIIVS